MRAGPPGGQPLGAGWQPWSVPRPRRRGASRHPSAPFRHIRHGASALRPPAGSRSTGGVWPPSSRRSRRDVASSARWPSPASPRAATCAVVSPPDRSGALWGSPPVRPPVAHAAATAAAPPRATRSPAGPSARGPGPPGLRRRSAAIAPGAWRTSPRPSRTSGGTPRGDDGRVADPAPPGGHRPTRGWGRSPGTWRPAAGPSPVRDP
jgi:hypothetical protein